MDLMRAATVALVVAGLASCRNEAVGEAEVVEFLKGAPPEAQQRVLSEMSAATVETPGLIARGDAPLTLLGRPPEVGDMAPDFTVTDAELAPVQLSDYRGKVLLISVVPSIDTPVCELQTHRMGEEEPKLPASLVKLITISRDLPFAQKRFLGETGMKTSIASDYKGGSFGQRWGLVVKESGLLARSMWVVDAHGKIVYRELVADQTKQPNYDAALGKIAELLVDTVNGKQ